MKYFFIVALSLNTVASPVVADPHCTPPRPDFTYPNYAQYGSEAENYSKAFSLTIRDALHEHGLRNLEVCEAKGADYNYDCDALEYGDVEELNPDYLNLSEEEYSAIDDANEIRTANLRSLFAACMGDS